MILKKILDLEAQIRSDPFNPKHHLALARAFLEKGDEERARKVIAVKRRLPSKEPSVHFEWGHLCEELGMPRQAIESYEQAIALNPKHPEYHFRIAQLFYERGAWERAMKHLQKTIALTPENQRAKEMLASIYEGMGMRGVSETLVSKNLIKSNDSVTPSFHLSEEDVEIMKNLFQGREMGYAQYQMDEKGILTPIYLHRPWDREEITQHLKGEIVLGLYPLRSDRTLKFSTIRIRIPNRKLLSNIKNEGFLAITEDHIHHYAKTIFDMLKGYGIPIYFENFGGRGRRLWIFFDVFIPVDLAERFLREILDRGPSPGVDLATDILLGTRGTGIGRVDEPIPIPLGINPLTGKRCFFIDREGEVFDDQLLYIRKIRTIQQDQIQHFLKTGKPPNLRGEAETLLKSIERKCAVLADILRKARSGRNLQPQEKLIVFFTIGFLNEGVNLIHGALEPCPDYRPQKVHRMVKRLKGKPISCPKIRQLMPERTAYLQCNCSFEIPEGGYPTPLLHHIALLSKLTRDTEFAR